MGLESLLTDAIKKKYGDELASKFSITQFVTYVCLIIVIDVVFRREISIYQWISQVSLYDMADNKAGLMAVKLSSILWATILYFMIKQGYMRVYKLVLSNFLSTEKIGSMIASLSLNAKKHAEKSDQVSLDLSKSFALEASSAQECVRALLRPSELMFFIAIVFCTSLLFNFSFTISSLIELILFCACFFLSIKFALDAMLVFVSSYIPAELYHKILLNSDTTLEDSFFECF